MVCKVKLGCSICTLALVLKQRQSALVPVLEILNTGFAQTEQLSVGPSVKRLRQHWLSLLQVTRLLRSSSSRQWQVRKQCLEACSTKGVRQQQRRCFVALAPQLLVKLQTRLQNAVVSWRKPASSSGNIFANKSFLDSKLTASIVSIVKDPCSNTPWLCCEASSFESSSAQDRTFLNTTSHRKGADCSRKAAQQLC